ncbi:MAG: sn-glycerol-3-phosphate ABC transporter ATP-binding protein UgpC [Rhodobacterales bacterium]|nr:sn-glycerol-3-phosphate ABC transporter ATP-binding protein UgpC [Rhodobacterales bacterium]
MAQLQLSDLRKSFGPARVIKGLDLDIADGEFVVFVGPSGCGKSTTLRMIAGLEDVTSGLIRLDGSDLTRTRPADRGIAMVFQSYALFPHMTVAENIGFGLQLRKEDRATIAKRVAEVAETLQLTPLLARYPRELSGGQRQRVAIGRAIIREPKVFLFDEPLSNLDAALRVQMRLEIARLHRHLGATMVYVTHDQVEAMTLADRIVVFNDGRIEQVGTPMELYEHPANRFVAGFIGAPAMNFLPAQATSSGLEVPGLAPMPMPSGKEGATELGLRPEHLTVVDASTADIVGEVELIERLGAETYAYVRVPGQPSDLTLRLPGETRMRGGSSIALKIDWTRAKWFDASGRVL